jgi:hypothetical protein
MTPPALPFPSTRTPLYIALGVIALQTLWYYPRLSAQIVCKWDLSRDPSRWCGKGVLVAGTFFAACAMALLTFATVPFLAWPVAGVLLFIAVVNQYIYAANLGDGRLHGSFFWVLAAVILGAVAFVLSVAK